MHQEIEITDKLGYRLLSKGFIDYDKLDRALQIRQKEDPRNRRTLAQILVNEFGLDHDKVFLEVKSLYGFRIPFLSMRKY